MSDVYQSLGVRPRNPVLVATSPVSHPVWSVGDIESEARMTVDRSVPASICTYKYRRWPRDEVSYS
jgi:hypothetical protein